MPPSPPPDTASVLAQSFEVDTPCRIQIDMPGVHTRLRPAKAEERIHVRLDVAEGASAQADQILDRLDISTQQKKGTVRVYSGADRTDAAWWRWLRTRSAALHLDVQLPTPTEANVLVPGGSLDAADLNGTFHFEAMGSPVQVRNLHGQLTVLAESSDVEITDCEGESVSATVAAGQLTVADTQADTITLRSASAPLTARRLSGTLDVQVNGGAATLDTIRGACTARAEGAPLDYTGCPSNDTTLTVVGTTLSTALPPDCGLTLTMEGPDLTLDNALRFEGEHDSEIIKGTLAGGGPSLSLRAPQGRVECRSAE